MKLKLAIIYGILIWIVTLILSNIITPFFISRLPDMNIITPIILIIVTGFFGILYIRNIDSNEVIEGFLVGIIFIIIDIVLDYIFLVSFHAKNLIFTDYSFHLSSMIILTLLITTFLGYLSQMNIDLKCCLETK